MIYGDKKPPITISLDYADLRQKIGLLWTLVLGVIGSVIGGTIANAIGSGDIMELNVIGFICAVVAAVLLLSIADRARLGAGPRRGQLGRG